MGAFTRKIYGPDYSFGFHCLAEKCRHSCCIGWEIDIDDKSLQRYRLVPGELGRKLHDCIRDPKDETDENGEDTCAHFILGKDERCPFLNERGLCDLILNLGEDSLCEICTEHPRFYNIFSDHTEMGYGLCCEEAARLLFTWQTPIRLAETDSVPSEEEHIGEDPEEAEILQIREELFFLLQDRGCNLSDRFRNILNAVDLPERSMYLDYAFWGRVLGSLERLDPSWDAEITKLASSTIEPSQLQHFMDLMSEKDRIFEYENLMWYFLYRHLGEVTDKEEIRDIVLWAMLSVEILEYLGASRYLEKGDFTLDDQIDLARMFSSEIEYSDENIECMTSHIRERNYLL